MQEKRESVLSVKTLEFHIKNKTDHICGLKICQFGGHEEFASQAGRKNLNLIHGIRQAMPSLRTHFTGLMTMARFIG